MATLKAQYATDINFEPGLVVVTQHQYSADGAESVQMWFTPQSIDEFYRLLKRAGYDASVAAVMEPKCGG